jgi:hypothetical protein
MTIYDDVFCGLRLLSLVETQCVDLNSHSGTDPPNESGSTNPGTKTPFPIMTQNPYSSTQTLEQLQGDGFVYIQA